MKLKILAALLLFAAQSQAQTVHDDLEWVTTAGTSFTSPDFNFCNDTQINYEISTPGNQFGPPVAPYPGIIFPADVPNDPATAIPIHFDFSAKVCNLRIRLVDFDPGETLESITPSYSSLIAETGVLEDPGSSMNAIETDVFNTSGWIQWTGPVTAVSVTYHRPSAGYGLMMDSVVFECCPTTPPLFCECPHTAQFNTIGSVDSEGNTTSTINLNSMGTPVQTIFIDLPFYVSNVDDDCIKHEPGNIERSGTILGASPIAGTSGTLYDPHNLGYSRRIYWTFTTPTAVNTTIGLDLKFPGLLNLSSCDNDVSYCLDVTFVNEDCTACGEQICTSFPGDTSVLGGPDPLFNDAAEEIGFLLTPNPTDGKVEVLIQNEALVGGRLNIINSAGALVKKSTIKELKKTIDVSDLAKGTYFVSIENNGQVASTKLIVK